MFCGVFVVVCMNFIAFSCTSGDVWALDCMPLFTDELKLDSLQFCSLSGMVLSVHAWEFHNCWGYLLFAFMHLVRVFGCVHQLGWIC